MSERMVSVTREIPASSAEIFDVLASPELHSVIDGSNTVTGSRKGPDRLALGAKFGMRMKIFGIPYAMSNKVVEFEEDRLIAWQHFGKHRWRYQLEPLNEVSTLVTETFDWSSALSPAYIEKTGWPERHVPNMERTLERLEAHLATS